MEARRLAILCSHLNPPGPNPSRDPTLRVSVCNSVSSGDDGKLESSNLQNDCVFCKIIRGESPCLKLYEDDMCLCILDTNPLSNGHSLIIPKLHYPTLEETPPSVVSAMCSKVPLISNAIVKATDSDSFNLLVNNGAAAGQVIFHTHIHIIPRKEHDCLWASESVRRHTLKLDKEASQLVSRVRQQLCSLPQEQLVQPS
ncbi:PREDICTED: adenylylsulfatase HINT3 isoform X2 [Camelina sativa]|uniref:Adenylylsulfatase HINT3 isoform X1 n=1 Tax=Camelina sativa TaxID=90675 RepID=A0ABM0UK22_CAMSA|nr:PREDICTED: adenylylsulfatase HINT3 isoform X1 [Camelina sativa]XP_010442281.1 PREDICTED: adenylylsulfatase HINT3 isoform X2 [Camelina sativa]